MTSDEPEPAADGPSDPAAGDDPSAQKPSGNDGDAGSPTPEPGDDEPGDDADYAQTATIINNFYAEVATHTVGVDGGHEPFTKPSIRRGSGVLAPADVDQALRYYVEPAPFRGALQVLTTHHLIVLTGLGSGKKAGSLALARAVCLDSASFTVFPPTRSLQELSTYKGYRPGQVFLTHDWVPVSSDSGSVASWDLQQLATRLKRSDAYLVITVEGAGQLRTLLGERYIRWPAPDAAALLDTCAAKLPRLRPSDTDWEQLRTRATEIRSPRLVIKLAEAAAKDLKGALAEASETENSAVADWFTAKPSRWQVWAVTALAFLSGVGERNFERLQSALANAHLSTDAQLPDGEHRERPNDNEPFPQTRWKLANDASLGGFLNERNQSAPVGSEYRPAFRTKACRQHFMMELNRRFGDELWTPVRDWLFDLADQPDFGEAQVAAGYGLALLTRCALGEVEATYLRPWSAGLLQNRLMAVSVLWAMAEDERMAPAALRIAVSWVHNQGQERAITAALALGGPLGQRHPSEAMRWLWVLSQRGERVRRVACTAMSQLFASESEANVDKSRVIRFLLVQKIRPLLKPDETARRESAVRQRRAALAVANSVLATTQALSDVPVMAAVLRRRSADLQPVGELWAATLNSVPHRREAVRALHRTLAALTDDGESLDLAGRLGRAILPRLTPRSVQVLALALPDPRRAEEISATVVAAFLGTHLQPIGAIT